MKKTFYIILAIITSILFYILNAIMSGFSEIRSFYSNYSFLNALKLTSLNIFGFYTQIRTHSFISLIIISILFGMLFSLIAYKTNNIKRNFANKIGILGTTGIFIGVLAPGCAACGIGIASTLGLGAFLTFLPYEGLELSILSIALLLFANYKVTKGLLNKNSCKIKLNLSDSNNQNLKGGY